MPEIADLLAGSAPDTLLCAVGGITDGRGLLAAALLLGADGVMLGTRLWASREANVHPNMHQAALVADGDATIRTKLMDIVRRYDWPSRYTVRALRKKFIERWSGKDMDLAAAFETGHTKWRRARDEGDTDGSNTVVGEGIGLVHSIEPVKAIIDNMVTDAEGRIRHFGSRS